METITLNPIGKIFTPHNNISDMPIQAIAADGVKGHIELLPEFEPGLKDLDGFSHITLLYHFHKADGFELVTTPFLDTAQHGVFATRAPKRPNAIGISTVRLTGIENNIIHIEQVDMLNGSPLIDIKPFHPQFDHRENVQSGWLEKSKNSTPNQLRSDDRFR
ncbi:tRNA (N6-threonylcarbamoyladenosine(37)-N6)-methyltransferase TrmO [Alkalitalea saponilacus]|uniref:tRNA-Thr(GGU) m(6)t(6)A37 methyltransferase TsaA n=1 Tax=Alkalitalea saponilacus TaxID=889453 RepID=A0A1T5GNW9_9BACT|nr:tRNA (N6-threonylcarbamoyladenosine(37)-N6)-methyltransferase TrmO [Alkalitalea saponilacus]ASB48247.1 tRNA (N6-threonylcarbamoyladenosine(37)-N6)-methyltransferase TrmO [Alkalitalea saponilacus]SKC10116.1 tRNA-Thr(GGU) m(6)t(6)A37 methyltransferase TsaA [Alkalitalea saponilacus]